MSVVVFIVWLSIMTDMVIAGVYRNVIKKSYVLPANIKATKVGMSTVISVLRVVTLLNSVA